MIPGMPENENAAGPADAFDACIEGEILPAQLNIEVAVLDRHFTVEEPVKLESGVEACLQRNDPHHGYKVKLFRWNEGMEWSISGPLA